MDRDESVNFYLIFMDTTMVSMELDSDDVEDLLIDIPDELAMEKAYANWKEVLQRLPTHKNHLIADLMPRRRQPANL